MMISALKAKHIYDSTLFIVTAKHGQSPINPVKVNKPGHFADLVAATATATGTTNDPGAVAIANANNCPTPAPTTGPCGFVQDDDIALIWLADQSQTGAVAAYLNKYAASLNPDGSFKSSGPLFIDEVMAGNELSLKFNDPSTDPATPDIIVQPVYGTIYTGSTAKNAEHGGLSFADTNVGLIVSNPGISAQVVKTPVATSQVAPSILKALGLNPGALQAVQKEGTRLLPFLFTQNDNNNNQ
jgi:arylsulfatase A-like enzyme